jgi:hypothetical protein
MVSSLAPSEDVWFKYRANVPSSLSVTPIRINMMRNTFRANVSSPIKKEGISMAGINTSRLTLKILGIVFRSLKLNLSFSSTPKDKPKIYKKLHIYGREYKIRAWDSNRSIISLICFSSSTKKPRKLL